MATNTPSAQLHDLLVTHDFDVESKDAKRPNTTPAPENADMFVFDFEANGNNYGTVVTLFDKDGTLNLFYGDNVGKSMEPADKKEWYDFLYQLTMFAKRNCPSFEMQNISRLKYTLKGISAINEGLFEGYYGNKKVSYAGEPTEARLMIKHNRQLGENDKRYRYVESLFIETADDQRFRLPFNNLAGGRAMLEHVRQGGKPYDIRGCHIAEIVEDAKVLSRFNRAKQNKIFEGETNELVEASTAYYESVRHTIKSLGNGRGYQKYFESWSPAQINETDTLVDSIKEMFIEQTLDSRIEQALPILAKIRQRETNMKEAQVFENWVNQVCEGTWALPDDPDQRAKLQKLMSEPLLVGPDATNATEQLYDLVGDDQLFDILGDIADQEGGPDMNAWDDPRVMDRMYELGIDVAQPDGDQEQGEPEDQLDEIGDTPAGREKLEKYMDKADVQVSQHWADVHNKSHLPVDKKMAKRNAGSVAASNRLGGFGIQPSLRARAEQEVEEVIDYDTLNQMASHPMAAPLAAAGGAAIGGAIGGGIKKTVDYFQKKKEQNAQARRSQQQGMAEGSMKHQMHADADRMSREQFCDKYGNENGEFWDNINSELTEGHDDGPVAAALTRKIMSQRLDLLKKYGPVKVTQAIDSAAEFFGDVDEIGSSDLNAYVQYVEKELGGMAEAIDPNNPRDYEIPAYQRKEKGMPPLHPSDIEDKDNSSPTTQQGLDTLKNKLGIRENKDLTRIKQLLQKI